MALEDLQRDVASNRAEAQRLLAADPDNPLVRHLVNTVWPFQEAMIDELGEQAEALDDAVDQAGDMLQADTAGVFAAVILANQRLCDELDRKLGPSEVELRGFIVAARQAAVEASELLEDITIPPTEEDDTDSTVDADGDDDDDDDDE
jgi:hypothetical protein